MTVADGFAGGAGVRFGCTRRGSARSSQSLGRRRDRLRWRGTFGTVAIHGAFGVGGFPYVKICAGSAFDADDLLERVHDVDEVAFRRDDGVDVLVARWSLVDDALVFAALDAARLLGEIRRGERSLRFLTAQSPAGSVRAAREGIGVAFAAHDEAARAHASGDDAEIAFASSNGSFARDEHIFG